MLETKGHLRNLKTCMTGCDLNIELKSRKKLYGTSKGHFSYCNIFLVFLKISHTLAMYLVTVSCLLYVTN